MSDAVLAAPQEGGAGQNTHSHQPGNPSPLRRRVTDVPKENVIWFMDHGQSDWLIATELARAELTAQRDGYVIRWAHLGVCQITEPDPDGRIINAEWRVTLDGGPDADPRAREVEQQLLREARLCIDLGGEPACVEREGQRSILRRYASCYIYWEHVSVCQLFEPDGRTLIDECGEWALDPATDPRAREIAAHLLLDAGV